MYIYIYICVCVCVFMYIEISVEAVSVCDQLCLEMGNHVTSVLSLLEAELEKLAFQRVAKNIIKARENKHNGIRFFSKS